MARKIPDEIVREFGLQPDGVLAAKCGVSLSAVTQARRKRRIPRFGGERADCRRWTANEISSLGRAPDVVVALETLRKPKAVRSKRLRNQIASAAVDKSIEFPGPLLEKMRAIANEGSAR